MDRYQEEIRRVAAKSVKDLNLDGSGSNHCNNNNNNNNNNALLPRRLSNGSDISLASSSSSAAPSGGVNVAMARMEYLQKVNQLNLSNNLLSGGGAAPVAPPQSVPRRTSAGGAGENALNNRILTAGKAKSAGSLMNGGSGAISNGGCGGIDRRSIIAASKHAAPRVGGAAAGEPPHPPDVGGLRASAVILKQSGPLTHTLNSSQVR